MSVNERMGLDEDFINVLLYELHQPYNKKELEERIKKGKEAYRVAKIIDKAIINQVFRDFPELKEKFNTKDKKSIYIIK